MKLGSTKYGVDNPDFYGRDQFKNILPFIKGTPEWLILGGPASGNEAQYAASLWPNIKIVGVEPNPEARQWQWTHGRWSKDWHLLPVALADVSGKSSIRIPPGYLESASLDPVHVVGCDIQELSEVDTDTLDGIDKVYGPFNNGILWMDIEGYEYRALLGAKGLMERKAFLLINVEMLSRVTEVMTGVPRLMEEYGYVQVHEWNASEGCRDRVYVMER